MLEEFVESVLEGKNGFRLERPWIPDGELLAIVPILREVDGDKSYYTLREVDVEIKDTGYVGQVSISGKGLDKPLLVLASEVLEGQGTQSRGVVHSTVVMPNITKAVETRCVHQSHPVRGNADFQVVGVAPRTVAKNLIAGDQYAVWNSVATYSIAMANTGLIPNRSNAAERVGPVVDSLPKLMKQTQERLEDTLSKIPCFENQVGANIVGLDGVEGIETFNHPKAWEARYKDVMGKHVPETKKSKLFKIDESECINYVREFLESLKCAELTVVEETRDYAVYRFQVEDYIGEFVAIGGELVYLFVMKKGSENSGEVQHRPVGINYDDFSTAVRFDYPATRIVGYTPPSTTSTLGLKEKRGWNEVISTLTSHSEGLTWSELQSATNLNPVTLTNRLKEGMSQGVIKKDIRSNGKTVYKLNLE